MEPILDRDLFYPPEPHSRLRSRSQHILTTLAAFVAFLPIAVGALHLFALGDNPVAAIRDHIATALTEPSAPSFAGRSLAAASAQLSGIDALADSVFRWVCPYIRTCPDDALLASTAPVPPPAPVSAPAALATTPPAAPAYVPSPPQRTVINQPVIERIIEREVAAPATATTAAGSVSQAVFETRLQQLEQSLNARLAASAAQTSATYIPVTTFAPSQRIDNLSNTTISNPTITGGSITASSISGTISNVLDTLSGAIATLTGTELTYTRATFISATTTNLYASSLTAADATVGSLSATTTATSTFAGGVTVQRINGTATSTLSGLVVDSSGLRLSALDCSSMGNGGTLTTDANGNVVCAADDGGAGSTVGGSDTYVQFNNDGSFAGDSGLTYASSSDRLTIVNASTTNITASYASTSNLVVSAGFTFKTVTGFLKATAGAVATALIDLANEVTGILPVANGGTGTSTAPAYGQIFIGNASGGYTLTATSSLGLLTTNVAEGSNLYFTTNRVAAVLAGTTSDALVEGGTNRYYTDTRVGSYISGSSTIPHIGGSAYGDLLSWTGTGWTTRATSTLAIDTDNTTEGSTNLFFTNARARSVLSVSSPLTYNSGTGAFGFDFSTANTWTGLNVFGQASSTRLSIFDRLYVGGTATSTFDGAGNLSLVSNGLTVGTSQFVVSGGNVGIGTTTPDARFAFYTANVATHADIFGANQSTGAAFDIKTDSGAPPSGAVQGVNLDYEVNYAPGSTISNNLNGLRVLARTGSSVSDVLTGEFAGVNIQVAHKGSNAASTITGLITSAAGNVGNITDLNQIRAGTPSTSGTITNAYGLRISGQKVSGVTNGYGIYQEGASDINYFGGNVGIGTTTPTNYAANGWSLLAIDSSGGTANTNARGLMIQAPTLSTGKVVYSGLGVETTQSYNTAYFGFNYVGNASASNYLSLGLAGNGSILNVTGNGNVGIGTTSPAAKLEVVETSVSNVRGMANIQISDNTTAPLFRFYKARGTATSPTAVLSGDVIGNVSFGGYDGSTAWGPNDDTSVVRFRGISQENWSSTAHGADLLFETTPKGSISVTERLRITSEGNVGIGTTSPLAKLAVQATAGQTAPVFEVASSSNATPFLTITSSGSVGIGTSSPSTKLEVVSASSGSTADQLYLTNFASATSTASRLTFRTADASGSATSTAALTSILQQNFNGGSGDLVFSTLQSGTLTEVFRATALGNVGIGTTTPLRKFAVEQAGSVAQFSVAYDTTRTTELQTDSSGDAVISPSGGDVRINDGNLWVCSGGACASGAPTGTGNFILENRFGVASSTPWAAISVGADSAIVTTEKSLTDGATIAIDWNQGNQQRATLGGNRTITFSNYLAGQILRLVVCQDATGSRTLTWPAAVRWNGGSAPTLTTTANKCDLLTFVATNATSSLVIFGGSALNF